MDRAVISLDVPVKIAVDPNDPLAGRLRPGMSVEPTIDTKASDHTALSALPGSKVNG